MAICSLLGQVRNFCDDIARGVDNPAQSQSRQLNKGSHPLYIYIGVFSYLYFFGPSDLTPQFFYLFQQSCCADAKFRGVIRKQDVRYFEANGNMVVGQLEDGENQERNGMKRYPKS